MSSEGSVHPKYKKKVFYILSAVSSRYRGRRGGKMEPAVCVGGTIMQEVMVQVKQFKTQN